MLRDLLMATVFIWKYDYFLFFVVWWVGVVVERGGGDYIKMNDDHLAYFCEPQFQVLMCRAFLESWCPQYWNRLSAVLK